MMRCGHMAPPEMNDYVEDCIRRHDEVQLMALRKWLNNNRQRYDAARLIQRIEEYLRSAMSWLTQASKARITKPHSKSLRLTTSPERLRALHRVIDGQSGRFVAMVIHYAWQEGWFTQKPTHAAVTEEFGDIGTRQNFNTYFKQAMTSEEERAIAEALNA